MPLLAHCTAMREKSTKQVTETEAVANRGSDGDRKPWKHRNGSPIDVGMKMNGRLVDGEGEWRAYVCVREVGRSKGGTER